MKTSLLLASGILIAGSGAFAQTVNFHDASQGYAHYGGYNVLYYGQGAASDPGNNVWNGFGQYGGGPGSTDFYGGGNPDSGHGSVPDGNPGNPYSWHNGTTSSGANLFSPVNSGAGNVGNATSTGTISPVTLSMNYGFDNGSTTGTTQGTTSWLLSYAAVVNSGSPGIGTSANPMGQAALANVPAGTYNLFLYGANYDGTRGASFSVIAGNDGTPMGGFTSAINPNANPNGPLTTLALGVDYVEFTGVTPNASGDITIDWGAVSNPNSGLTGEGDFNGLQLVATSLVPEPSVLTLIGLGSGMLTILRRKK